jgi:hypothetical protein
LGNAQSPLHAVYIHVKKAIEDSNAMMEAAGYHPIVYEDYLQLLSATLTSVSDMDVQTL